MLIVMGHIDADSLNSKPIMSSACYQEDGSAKAGVSYEETFGEVIFADQENPGRNSAQSCLLHHLAAPVEVSTVNRHQYDRKPILVRNHGIQGTPDGGDGVEGAIERRQVRLMDPDGCNLGFRLRVAEFTGQWEVAESFGSPGNHLHTCRVKIIDTDTFPSSKYEDQLKNLVSRSHVLFPCVFHASLAKACTT